MKDPRFNFYVDNYEGGTQKFTLEQDGAYLRLLILQFRTGPFTAEEAMDLLMQRCRGNAHACAQIWKFLMPKFKTDGKIFWSERMTMEIEKSARNSEAQSGRAKSRWNVKNDDAGALPTHMPLKTKPNNSIRSKDVHKLEGGVGETTLGAESQPAPLYPAIADNIHGVVQYLNQVAGFNYDPCVSIYQTYIFELYKKGVSFADMRRVIDYKFKEWGHNQLRHNLSPDILFAPDKFDKYINQVNFPPPREVTNQSSTQAINLP